MEPKSSKKTQKMVTESWKHYFQDSWAFFSMVLSFFANFGSETSLKNCQESCRNVTRSEKANVLFLQYLPHEINIFHVLRFRFSLTFSGNLVCLCVCFSQPVEFSIFLIFLMMLSKCWPFWEPKHPPKYTQNTEKNGPEKKRKKNIKKTLKCNLSQHGNGKRVLFLELPNMTKRAKRIQKLRNMSQSVQRGDEQSFKTCSRSPLGVKRVKTC